MPKNSPGYQVHEPLRRQTRRQRSLSSSYHIVESLGVSKEGEHEWIDSVGNEVNAASFSSKYTEYLYI